MVLIMCGFSKMAQQPIHLVVSLSLLREMLPGHVISLRGDIGWPPRSPDLTPCDFFLWGYLKAKVSEQRPLTLEALKEAIRQEVAAITPEMILKVMDNYREATSVYQCSRPPVE